MSIHNYDSLCTASACVTNSCKAIIMYNPTIEHFRQDDWICMYIEYVQCHSWKIFTQHSDKLCSADPIIPVVIPHRQQGCSSSRLCSSCVQLHPFYRKPAVAIGQACQGNVFIMASAEVDKNSCAYHTAVQWQITARTSHRRLKPLKYAQTTIE